LKCLLNAVLHHVIVGHTEIIIYYINMGLKVNSSKHPKFEGHVTPNGLEYQKSVLLIFRYFVGVS